MLYHGREEDREKGGRGKRVEKRSVGNEVDEGERRRVGELKGEQPPTYVILN